jgi:hypothetical protein
MSSRSVIMSRTIALLLAAALAGCDAGNYSNEDIDFQLAVPERQDIAVRMPAQALESSDAPEHYRSTRNTVKALDGLADAFIGLIDHVRAYPPSERQMGRRVWGPFPLTENPLWVVRVVVERANQAGQPLSFRYWIEFRARADQNAPFAPLILGEFAPSGGARRGTGRLQFTSTAARNAGYPLGGLAPIDTLDIEYKTDAFPTRIKITLVNFPAKEMAVFEHSEEQDGSGAMTFTFPLPGPGMVVVEIHSRWTGSGAGRADIQVLSASLPLLVGKKGTDCWTIGAVPTYVHRDWQDPAHPELGMESNCVFPPRAP